MNGSVKKAVIPAAGLGTRFLPATKTVPKEMLPIVDKPIILYNIEECIRAGIEDVILVAGRGKSAIEDFFDTSYEVEDVLLKAGKTELLERVQSVKDKINIISIRQKEAKGLGHAVYIAQPVIGDEPFAVLLGDEIMIETEECKSAIGDLVDLTQKNGKSTVAVMPVEKADVSKYGIIECTEKSENLWEVSAVVEKPSLESAPSQLALPGRYVFGPEILSALRDTKPGKNGEIQLTDAMTQVAKSEGLLATVLKSRRFDAGDKFGYLQANIEMGLENAEVKEKLQHYLKQLASTL
ncbi:MAG: UTP--glucose-1-phosphate uridylyltransferase GalU [Bdellovibrionales bacterium]|nr:UTP--glucose-1-phosphate uridylyltransferase GalU [Bdellovibrionales bacterium]